MDATQDYRDGDEVAAGAADTTGTSGTAGAGVTDAAAGSTDTTGTSGTADTADSAAQASVAADTAGSAAQASSGGETAADGIADVTGEYVLNTNTKKFHRPSCSSVAQMSPENKAAFSGSREELIAAGYDPCKRCNP